MPKQPERRRGAPSGIPKRPTDLDPATFRALTRRADVTAVRVLDEDHGTALRARLGIEGESGLPSRAFVKLTPVRPVERLFNRFMNMAHNEAQVYRLLGSELADVMPRAYGTASQGRGGRAIVVMEDLTERGAQFPAMATGCTADQALAIAAMLGSVHRRYWQSDRLLNGDLAGFSPEASRATTMGPHSWHLIRTIPKSFNDIAPPDFQKQAGMLVRHRWAIARFMQTEPFSLIHGDTHVGNMCFIGDRPVLFDWQIASCGPAVKDLAYFACTSIDVPTRRAIDEQLVQSYIDSLNSDGKVRLTFEAARKKYRLLAFTAYIAAGVTAVFGRRLQGEQPTRAGLHRAVEAIRDFGTFDLVNRELGL